MAPTAAEEVAFVQVPLQAVADPVFYKMRNMYQPTRLYTRRIKNRRTEAIAVALALAPE